MGILVKALDGKIVTSIIDLVAKVWVVKKTDTSYLKNAVIKCSPKSITGE
jgi:hypothetical protein